MSASEEASYRIQSVAKLTGVPAATLRAWERRYGFPTPARTASAYRLFSPNDIELVRRMQKLVESGVAPSQAAQQLLSPKRGKPAPQLADPFQEAVARMVDAIQRLDLAATQHELRRTLLLADAHTVFSRVLQPVLRTIGELWQAGTISIAHEHLASQLITAVTLDLLRITGAPADAPSVLLACISDETHLLPLYGASLAISAWGFRPILLGAQTPPSAVARAVEALRPNLVGLSATIRPTPANRARELIDAYADACGSTPWAVGGAAAQDLARWVEPRGGVVVPPEPEAARTVIERAMFRRKRR